MAINTCILYICYCINIMSCYVRYDKMMLTHDIRLNFVHTLALVTSNAL